MTEVNENSCQAEFNGPKKQVVVGKDSEESNISHQIA